MRTVLTKRCREVLVMMRDASDRDDWEAAEIVADKGACWLGDDRLSRGTLTTLMRCMCLSDVSDTGGIERYVINGTGRAAIDDPEVIDRVLAGLRGGWNVDAAGNRIVDEDDETYEPMNRRFEAGKGNVMMHVPKGGTKGGT